jgi:hypothetical protein
MRKAGNSHFLVKFGGRVLASGLAMALSLPTPVYSELAVSAEVFVGIPAYSIALTPDRQMALVTTPGNPPTLTFIDVDTTSIVDTITLTGSSNAGLEIDITPDGSLALITNYVDQSFTIIDVGLRSIVGSPVPIGVNPAGITILPNGKTALVVNESSCGPSLHCLSVLETQSVNDWSSAVIVANIPVSRGPRMAVVTPNGRTALVPAGNDGVIDVVETSSVDGWAAA